MSDQRHPMLPITLPASLIGNVNCHELAVLFSLQSHYPNGTIPVHRLAQDTGISKRKVRMVLAELEDRGFLVRTRQHFDDGASMANRYELLVWGKGGASA